MSKGTKRKSKEIVKSLQKKTVIASINNEVFDYGNPEHMNTLSQFNKLQEIVLEKNPALSIEISYSISQSEGSNTTYKISPIDSAFETSLIEALFIYVGNNRHALPFTLEISYKNSEEFFAKLKQCTDYNPEIVEQYRESMFNVLAGFLVKIIKSDIRSLSKIEVYMPCIADEPKIEQVLYALEDNHFLRSLTIKDNSSLPLYLVSYKCDFPPINNYIFNKYSFQKSSATAAPSPGCSSLLYMKNKKSLELNEIRKKCTTSKIPITQREKFLLEMACGQPFITLINVWDKIKPSLVSELEEIIELFIPAKKSFGYMITDYLGDSLRVYL